MMFHELKWSSQNKKHWIHRFPHFWMMKKHHKRPSPVKGVYTGSNITNGGQEQKPIAKNQQNATAIGYLKEPFWLNHFGRTILVGSRTKTNQMQRHFISASFVQLRAWDIWPAKPGGSPTISLVGLVNWPPEPRCISLTLWQPNWLYPCWSRTCDRTAV